MTTPDQRHERNSLNALRPSGGAAWWVIAQAVIFIGFFLVPTNLVPFGYQPSGSWLSIIRGIGVAFMLTGFIEFVGGISSQGRNLTPLPRPREKHSLIESGAYRLIRHPIYGGMILTVTGWTLFHTSVIHAVISLMTIVFFDAKARLEERILLERFPAYDTYRRSVRWRFVPRLY